MESSRKLEKNLESFMSSFCKTTLRGLLEFGSVFTPSFYTRSNQIQTIPDYYREIPSTSEILGSVAGAVFSTSLIMGTLYGFIYPLVPN